MNNDFSLDLPKACLFDLDGTLIHHEHEFFYSALCEVYGTLGQSPPSRESFDAMLATHTLFADIEEKYRTDFLESFWAEFDKQAFPQARAFPGSLETLDRFLTKGVRVAIITARTHLPEDVEHCLEPTGLLKHIEVISTLGESHLKTSPQDSTLKREQIEHVCRVFQIEPSSSAVFGDAPTDVLSGKAAGVMATVALLSGGIERSILENTSPDLLLPTVEKSLPFFSL